MFGDNLGAEQVAIEREGGHQIVYGDGDMIDPGNACHGCLL
jgi:hypothetical protein